MERSLFGRFGVVVFAFALALVSLLPASAQVQPSYDTLRVQDGETVQLYQASILWSPLILPTPNGGAWSFFTAQLRFPTEPDADPQLSNFKVFASRFDPASATWGPATALPGEISFGPTGAVDSEGTVHLVYTIRANLDEDSYGSLVYIKSTPEGGWTGPTLVAANENAGHQLSPDIAIDSTGGVHVAWQDQRSVTPEERVANASNADVFVADLNPDGTWSAPVQVSVRTEASDNGSRPQLLPDNDRLVLIWSVYSTSEDIGLDSATRVLWSTRPIGEPEGWAEPQTLFERDDTLIGGRFLDAAATQSGDISIVFGRRTAEENQTFVMRLPSGADAWSNASLVATGNRGSYPRVALGPDGTLYVVYNLAETGMTVEVGALGLAPGQELPGVEASLTSSEEGQQGIGSISVDTLGRVWVIYLHEMPSRTTPSEIRVLRGALISTEPTAPAQTSLPVVGTPEAEVAPEASPES